VGKIGVPDAILNKPGQLSDDEWEVMRAHCLAGTRILLEETPVQDELPEEHVQLGVSVFDGCNSPIMKIASIVAQTHHEKWDGSGYPRGLVGTAIPLEGRIAAVADVFDALSTKRQYKEAIPLDKCFKMMEESRGSHFDPEVLDAFLRRKSDIIRTFHEFADAVEPAQL
jgi:putative two-component system response regulator